MGRRDFDNYGTHHGLARWAVRHAIELAAISDNHLARILEPCCGDTAPFASAGREMGLRPHGYDVRPVDPPLWRDQDPDLLYRETSAADFDDVWWDQPRFDVIATNPPFRIGESVIRRSLELLCPYGAAAFLTKMAFLGTQDRSKLYLERPPAEVWILTARPSFTGDGKTDMAQEYCFIFWVGTALDEMRRKWEGQTRIHWIDNKPLMTEEEAKQRVRIEKEDADG